MGWALLCLTGLAGRPLTAGPAKHVQRSPRLGHLACLRSPGIITRVRDSTLGKRWGKELSHPVGRATPAPATFQERGGGKRLQITQPRMEIVALISLPLGLREISRLNAGRPARTPARVVAGLLFQTQGGQLARKACRTSRGPPPPPFPPIRSKKKNTPQKPHAASRQSLCVGRGRPRRGSLARLERTGMVVLSLSVGPQRRIGVLKG